MNRRALIQAASACAGTVVISHFFTACNASQGTETETDVASSSWIMPDESEPHKCTWMAFGATQKIWGERLLSGVQDNLATIAKAIAQYEPVNMLVRQEDYEIAARKCSSTVNLMVSPLDDLWIRDSGPVFVKNADGTLGAINFNFNGWGEKQAHGHDAQVAGLVTQQAGAKALKAEITLEGGGIEVDGQGTAIITESCVLNENRNPKMSKAECEAILKPLLGLRKIVWLPGIRGKDITDGHTDFYARFARPGVVVAGFDPDPASFDHPVTQKHLEQLRAATDADGRNLEVVVIEAPRQVRPTFKNDDFAAGYINFYVVNGAVIAPEFGDATADDKAKSTLQDLFPGRKVVQLNIDAIAAGGGGIHCTTQQEPRI